VNGFRGQRGQVLRLPREIAGIDHNAGTEKIEGVIFQTELQIQVLHWNQFCCIGINFATIIDAQVLYLKFPTFSHLCF